MTTEQMLEQQRVMLNELMDRLVRLEQDSVSRELAHNEANKAEWAAGERTRLRRNYAASILNGLVCNGALPSPHNIKLCWEAADRMIEEEGGKKA